MKSRFLSAAIVALTCLLATLSTALVRAQTPDPVQPASAQPPSLPAVAPADQSAEIEAIRQRMAQQDEELRQLRERLGQLQSDVHALPPVLPETAPNGDPGGVIPAGATTAMPCGDNPQIFQLQDRLASLEKKMNDNNVTDMAAAEEGYEVGSDTKLAATWKNGLRIASANKDFQMHIGGVLQYDMNFFENPPLINRPAAVGGIGPQPDSLDFRRVRIRMDGTFYEVFDFFMQVDFDNLVTPAGSPNIQSPATTSPAFDEMYINWGQLPYIGNFRAGNIKEPMGFEHMQSDAQLPFMERSYLQDFVFGPFNGGYAPGLELLNWREDQRGTWALGFFGSESDQFAFSLENNYAGTGRVTWCPIYDEPSDGRFVVHFGLAGSVRSTDEGLVRLRTRGDIRSGPPGILNPTYVDTNYTGAINANSQNIFCGEFAAVVGAFSVVAEYAGTTIPDATVAGVDHGTPIFQGGYVQCGYFLTGEHEIYDRHRGTFDRVIPYENAYWVHDQNGNCCHGWGAWQVLGRFNTIDLDNNGITGGFLSSFTLGVNWYWTSQARVQFNYDFTNRSQVKTTPQADINSVGTRFSWDF